MSSERPRRWVEVNSGHSKSQSIPKSKATSCSLAAATPGAGAFEETYKAKGLVTGREVNEKANKARRFTVTEISVDGVALKDC